MGTLRLVLGDQLTREISALQDIDISADIVLLAEVRTEASYVPHHKQKIVMIFSAMRHFADMLQEEGINIHYTDYLDPENTGSLIAEIGRIAKHHKFDRLVVTEPGEWRVLDELRRVETEAGIAVEIREDDRYFATHARFGKWLQGRKSLRMEYFYREMRRETGILMDGDKPAGGEWNFDADNRKALAKSAILPERLRFAPDTITCDVMEMVATEFPENFGDLTDFGWATTRRDALMALDQFIEEILPHFGDFQDAMRAGAPFIYHSLLSPYLNIGLLTPTEICDRAEKAYLESAAPINAVEGFIRQILGWREYVRGIYWHKMPDYADSNFLGAHRPLPSLYWTGKTDMRCMSEVVEQTRAYAYSHHIQRLMVTGNFALLAGISPRDVSDWYLAVYADAFEWVELPNTIGMALFADGGILASKPYAASGAYINRMSNFCAECHYKVKEKSGEDACPFNYLYWAFLIRNEQHLARNPRMRMPYRTLEKWSVKQKQTCMDEAERFLSRID
ncbi:MAG: cryptochrome/photolyase family protein [Rhizobiales bacterium]|nr:cryptochrome/photolyase family protein [Hyphomicrobiales bacterium]